ncbi:MAG TPA: hypothetical protein VM870_07565, partial [Pyrinomonadaceae bacterium]|nr:hypothetical protein [Pyrinomonadaceae bacterium]
ELCRAFPLSGPDEFHSAPPLVPSLWGPQGEVVKQVAVAHGAALSGDVFLLLSDALAAWYLRAHTAGAHDLLASFETAMASWRDSARRDNLVELLLAERRAARLRDDDYAVVRVTVERVQLS